MNMAHDIEADVMDKFVFSVDCHGLLITSIACDLHIMFINFCEHNMRLYFLFFKAQ